MLQCPTCGRIRERWDNNETKHLAITINGEKSKGQQRKDKEDRSLAYRQWRRTFGRTSLVSDIDQLEYRIIDGQIVPVALLEITRTDGDVEVKTGYLSKIVERFTKRDIQGRLITHIAEELGVQAYIVLFRYNLSQFWLYNLSTNIGWYRVGPEQYVSWINSLPNGRIKPDQYLPI